jgi:hypothetical protein
MNNEDMESKDQEALDKTSALIHRGTNTVCIGFLFVMYLLLSTGTCHMRPRINLNSITIPPGAVTESTIQVWDQTIGEYVQIPFKSYDQTNTNEPEPIDPWHVNENE